jgi:putative tryptophan/tyrosine transport system substrate-binding protein
MRRRDFIKLIGGAAVPWPFTARAQQTRKVSRIGYLGTSSSNLERRVLDAFRQKLRELGQVEGENIAIDYRWAEGQDDEFPQLAAELVRLKPDVIVTTGTPGTLAAKQATGTIPIPIVFSSSGSPVNAGLIASYARPGGNVTGFTFTGPELEGKRLQILKDVVPGLSRVAVLWNAASMGVEFYRQTEAAAAALSVILQPVVQASRMDDFERAFETIGRARPDALIVLADRLLLSHRNKITAFAANGRLPGMYPYREYVEAGGLLSYAPSSIERFCSAAIYVDKILRGAKPADLPVEQPTKFEFVLNLKTANALGLAVPPAILAQADEVIE